MWDGFNKRKFPRINLRCWIEIFSDDKTAAIHAQTQNVGIGGVCVLLDRDLGRFNPCRLRLELSKAKDRIECDGKVVWVVKTRDVKAKKTRYDTGIEFVDLSEGVKNHLQAFVTGQARASLTGIKK